MITSCSTPTSLARTHLELGLAYLNAHQPRLARHYLDQARAEAPKDPFTWQALALSAAQEHQVREAHSFYHHALQLAPHNPAIHNNYGAYLCREGEYSAGLRELKQALGDSNYASAPLVEENLRHCQAESTQNP
ncbi:MAG TPA: hypothetical protein VJB02_06710 [Coxiellaceae bacterium]|nr:hypothetical protein [Coxiellaceae bacterium]